MNWTWRVGDGASHQRGPAVVFDIDGVLSDAAGRQHFIERGQRNWASFFEACGDDPVIEEIARLLELLDPSLAVILLTGPAPAGAAADAGLAQALRPALGPPRHALPGGLRAGHRVQAGGRARTCGPTGSTCGSPSRTTRPTTPCTWRPASPASTSTPGTTTNAAAGPSRRRSATGREDQHRQVAPVVVRGHAAAEGDGGHEHLALPEGAAGDHDPAVGHDRAVAGRRRLDEVAARLDRLHDRRRRSPAPAPATCCTRRCWWGRRAAPHRRAPTRGCVRRRRPRRTPGGRAARPGCASARCRARGRRRSARPRGRPGARRRSGRARTRRRARGAPSRTCRRCARGSPGDDLVAEGGRRRRLGHPDDERRAELRGQPAEQGRLGRAGQRAGRAPRRPPATARARGRGGPR